MTNIILLNGACGIGKSTVAKLLHNKLAFSFLWKKDNQRRNISHYKDDLECKIKSGDMILDLSNNIIEHCCKNNIDLIFDGVLWEEKLINRLEKTVIENKGKFFHIYLNAPKDIRNKRLHNRGINGSLTFERACFFYDELEKMREKISMKEIDTSKLSAIQTCDKIIKILK